jgi:hypothetical protein
MPFEAMTQRCRHFVSQLILLFIGSIVDDLIKYDTCQVKYFRTLRIIDTRHMYVLWDARETNAT